LSDRDRRKLRRYIQRIPIRFTSGPIQGEGYLRNLSKQGMFIRADRLPEPRHDLQVVIDTPDGTKLELNCHVMWTTAELPDADNVAPGFGVSVLPGNDGFLEFYERLLLN